MGVSHLFIEKITIFAILFCMHLQFSKGNKTLADYGVLVAESSSGKENFCIIFLPTFGHMSQGKLPTESHSLQNDTDFDWCEEHPEVDVSRKVLLMGGHNCSVFDQTKHAEDRGAYAVIFAEPWPPKDSEHNETVIEAINITISFMRSESTEILGKMGNVTIRQYRPFDPRFDYSLLLMAFIAIFTVGVGAYWSGIRRHKIHLRENRLPTITQRQGSNQTTQSQPPRPKYQEASAANFSPLNVFFYVILMCGTLLLAYFFIDYMVYFIIAIFALASFGALYIIFDPLVSKIKQAGYCRTSFMCRGKQHSLNFARIILLVLSVGLPIYWICIRNRRYGWILQDILGVLFCINTLKAIRLPNMKICALLMSLLFVYDIFFVFITPFFTKGESIMERVAGGGGSGEKIPMVLLMQHMSQGGGISVCFQSFSLLGYGDILIPGLLVSYCHAFDLITSKRKIYFFMTLTCYGLGLFATFISLFLMNSAQPALLYLVPFTLIPPILLAWLKGELPTMWYGFKTIKIEAISDVQDIQAAAATNQAVEENAPSEVSVASRANETKQLLPS